MLFNKGISLFVDWNKKRKRNKNNIKKRVNYTNNIEIKKHKFLFFLISNQTKKMQATIQKNKTMENRDKKKKKKNQNNKSMLFLGKQNDDAPKKWIEK